jgi:hypothetical protein
LASGLAEKDGIISQCITIPSYPHLHFAPKPSTIAAKREFYGRPGFKDSRMHRMVNRSDTIVLNEGEQVFADDFSLATVIGKFSIVAQPRVPWAADFQDNSIGMNPVAQPHTFSGDRRHAFSR